MKKLLLLITAFLAGITSISAQNKTLIISEILANPNGNDSPYEYVELLATTNINFATTPYTIVFTDNGTATSNGWKAGNSVTYAFQISTGTVTAGQVVYVGGSSMTPLSNGGNGVRVKNTGSSGGDSFGSSNSGGVLGNGGDNCDGVAVFNVAASAITSSTVPLDAIFFGNSVGTAYKSNSSGYQLPVNDRYSGGKLGTNSFLATDPGADEILKATGTFNPSTNTFTTVRTWTKTTSPSYNNSSVTLGAPANIPPTVTLANPVVTGTAPATVTLSATAADSDGSILKVEFFNGGTLLATITSAPYTYNWTSVQAGTYSITAKATDNNNASTTSAVQTATVAANIPPVITLATPTVSGIAPATVALSATATDADGTIAKVEFFNGTTLIGTVLNAPYNFSWTNVAAGTYSITAKATDNNNAATTSAVKTATVSSSALNTPPTITLDNPVVSGAAPAAVSLSATAADNGSIAKVEFFNGSTLIGTVLTAPYNFVWSGIPSGVYNIKAKATDNMGLFTFSAVKTATVTNSGNIAPIIAFANPIVSGTAPATITLSATATDADGTITKVEFFNGSTLIATVLSPPYNYTWTNVPAGTYSITARATDNLNGVAISLMKTATVSTSALNTPPAITFDDPIVSGIAPATINLSATASDNGSVTKVEFFNGSTLIATKTVAPYTYAWTGVAVGTYSLKAKATDNMGLFTFSAIKTATVSNVANTPPTVTLSVPTVSGAAPATVGLSATASDANGTVTKVEFFNGTTLLTTITAAPYTYSWTNVAAGTYSITAKATDNNNAVTTSAVQTATVNNPVPNVPPTITLANPTVSGTAPATISLSATAADSDGTIVSVEFFNGTTLLATKTAAPYTYSWTGVAAGTYSITAKATDNAGSVTTSAIKTATVTAAANVAPTMVFNTTASKYVDLASGKVSCVMNNPTDPVIVTGLDITVGDEDLSTVTFTMTSSKTTVVPNANFTIVGTGTARKFKINPVGVGYATITLKITDAQGLNKSISLSLAVSASLATASVQDIYHTGVADGSTGVPVDEEYMFVADDETNVIKLFNRNNSGLSVYQFDVTQYLNLDGTEVDMEASFRSPTNPNRIYWMGSLSNSKTGQARPDRNRIFATDIVGTGANATLVFVGYYDNLRSKLITWGNNNGYNFTAKAATGIEPKRIDGFNIEGMEMGPDGTTLYIGFRAPYVGTGNNKALICPLQNFEAWFNNGTPSGNPVFGSPIVLNLNNHGIRSLAKNTSNEYIIVAGSYAADGTFELYSWNGLAATAPVLLDADLSNLKPEGIVSVPGSMAGPFQIDLISDLGSNILYADNLENKEVVAPNHRKFLSSKINVYPSGGKPAESLGIEEAQEETFTFYPNPVSDKLIVEFKVGEQPIIKFSVYALNGTLVKEITADLSANKATLDLSGLTTGNYLIKLHTPIPQTINIVKL